MVDHARAEAEGRTARIDAFRRRLPGDVRLEIADIDWLVAQLDRVTEERDRYREALAEARSKIR